MIYLDNAATTLKKPEECYEAVLNAMKTAGNADRGVNGASLGAMEILFTARSELAGLFGGDDPSRLIFTQNSTEALNTAIMGIIEPGDHVITTEAEHNSVLRPLYEMEERGTSLTIVHCDTLGRIDYAEMESAIRPDTKAIICTHGSNLTGNVTDIDRIGKLCKEHGILFVLDASQTAGTIPIDVKKAGIDILCFTGHKGLFGPQGTGGLYVNTEYPIKPLKRGGSGIKTYERKHPSVYPTALEAGTLNSHGIAGLAASVSFIMETGVERIHAKEIALAERFYQGVKEVEGVRLFGDYEAKERCPIVTLNIGDLDSSMVSDELAFSYEIATRAGAHCAPLMHKALGTEKSGAVRFSFSYFNTEEEVDQAILAVKEIAENAITNI